MDVLKDKYAEIKEQAKQSISELQSATKEGEKLIVVRAGWTGDFCFLVDKIIDGKAYWLRYLSGEPSGSYSVNASVQDFRRYTGICKKEIEKAWKNESLAQFWSNRGFKIVDERPLGTNKYLFVKGKKTELYPWVSIVQQYYSVSGHFQLCRVSNGEDGWGTLSTE